MSTPAPGFMDPPKAAAVLERALDPKVPVTVADAAARSGLALRDAERGLQVLTREHRGQLRVTSEGELVYRFPYGFTRPWVTRDAFDRAVHRGGQLLVAAARFIARAWISIALVGYASLFLALILATELSKKDSSSGRSSGGGGGMAYVLFRVLGDSLYWTFRPYSSFGIGDRRPVRERERNEPKVPLYERVNRFLFGPTLPPEDPRAGERNVLAAIRAGKGRIGLADVMRVTGLPREVADPMMARLMLDYDGDVDVSEDGGIVYRFPALRKTAVDETAPEPPAAWSRSPTLAPFTGNSFGANLAVGLLNAFNLFMGFWAIDHAMTIERVVALFSRARHVVPVLDTGTPIALGVVPIVFSLFLFAIPLARAIARPRRAREVKREKGRLALLREVIERTRDKRPVVDAELTTAWRVATGEEPRSMDLSRELTAMGGDVEVTPEGEARWRFVDLETEAAAVEAEREVAADDEARLGRVVFATDER